MSSSIPGTEQINQIAVVMVAYDLRVGYRVVPMLDIKIGNDWYYIEADKVEQVF